MLEESSPPPEQPAAEPAPASVAPPPARRRPHPILRVLGVLAALVAALLVASLTIDLGPSLRTRAETAGSKYLERPMHIGGLRVELLTGTFEVDDLVIEGLAPTDRPFLKAKRILVNLPWWSIFSRELIIENVDMSDWEMLVEQFPNGRHNFPKIVHESKAPKGPKRFTTTVRSVIARRGQFTFEDHGTPWSTVARNLEVNVYKGLTRYQGTAQFSGGTIKIQSYEAFRADMQTRFHIDGGFVQLERIDLKSEGATSVADGYVDLGHWPEMLYNVKSRVDFPIEKRIFFKDMNFTVAGYGDFTGTFHFFKGGRELKGTFKSPEAGVNAWRFPNVSGSLLWVPSKFEVTDVTSGLYGGRARFNYSMGPFGQPRPAQAVWDTTYTDVDLSQLSDFLETQGLRLAGRASGHNRLEWPLGQFAKKHGAGQVSATAPPGVVPLGRQASPDLIARVDPLPQEQGPFNSHLWIGYVPVAGEIAYTLDPDWISVQNGWAATERTYVDFTGRTGWGQRSQMPFHVTSIDWQESDRLLAGIMTAFGAPTGGIQIGGRGEFDGTFLEAFSQPRIEGHFVGERMRAWDVQWGRTAADLVIENSYVTISKALIQEGESTIAAEGRFSLGYPRKDNGEEINAVIRMTRRTLRDLRHAFQLDDYPVEGIASGEYHIWGKYETPDGFGRLQLDRGTAYGETFDVATANLRFETTGVRLDGIDITKSTGRVTGAAWVAWDGNYSFDADAARIPVESLVTLSFPRAPLSGLLQFTATGTGTFASPRYDVRLRVDDLFAGDEGIGQVTGRLSLRGDVLTMDVDAASPRLSVTGSGRLALTPQMDAEMTLQFTQTSLDPYIRFFQPKLSPFTTAVADGTIRAVGELADIDHLVIDTTVDNVTLEAVRLSGPQRGADQAGARSTYPAGRAVPAGRGGHGTRAEPATWRCTTTGSRSKRRAMPTSASCRGSSATSAAPGAPHSTRRFRVRSTRRCSPAMRRSPTDAPLHDAAAQPAGGEGQAVVRRAGDPHRRHDRRARRRAGPARRPRRDQGLPIDELSLTATGEQMHLRYPEGLSFHRRRDARAARQPLLARCSAAPSSSGTVCTRSVSSPTSTCSISAAAAPALPAAARRGREPADPIRHPGPGAADAAGREQSGASRGGRGPDVDRHLRSADPARTRGDRARRDLLRGQSVSGHARHYRFSQPRAIEPFFDIEAETRVRVPSETLPGDARRQRDVRRPHEPRAEFRSTAARRRHRLAAVRPDHRRGDAELRALRPAGRDAVGGSAAARRACPVRHRTDRRTRSGAPSSRRSGSIWCSSAPASGRRTTR